jgi:Inner membrane protein YgaP-like, transmembrane domain
MFKNTSSVDRVIRAIIGVALIAMVFVGPATPWGWIGLVPLATAAMGFCPFYRVFGITTCRLGTGDAQHHGA